MLSPASLRVCCLAVMAPALTKADRRADCLPVVLSEPYCISKSADVLKSQNINTFGLSKLEFKTSCPLTKRKAFMQRAWWRTPLKSGPGFLFKTRYSVTDPSRSVLSGIRTNTDVKSKTWQSTKVTTALADKLRLKYTMSKNSTTAKNMGLAKANTSLGLQNLKKMKRISQLSHGNKSPSALNNIGESSLDVPDSVNSELQSALLITEINASISEQIPDTDVSASDNEVLMQNSISKDGMLPVLDNISAMIPTCDDPSVAPTISNCNAPESAAMPDVGTLSPSESTVDLPVSLTDAVGLTSDTAVSLKDSILCTLNSFESFSSTSCNVADNANNDIPFSSESKISMDSTDNIPFHSVDSSGIEEELLNYSVTDLPSDSDVTASLSSPEDFKNNSIGMFTNLQFPASREPSKELETTSILPDTLFCDSIVQTPRMPTGLKDYSSRKVVTFINDLGVKKLCCICSPQDLKSLEVSLKSIDEKINSSLDQSQYLLVRHMNTHVKQQLKKFTKHYQRKLSIPCQRQRKNGNVKSGKDLVDLKAELLQSEDVKNLSTAALVSLVRKLESSGSSSKLLPQQKLSSQNSELESTDKTSVTFDPEDITDIKHTSSVLLAKMKNMLKSVDPYLTESSEDELESENETGSDESAVELSDRKRALWKYLTERAALASRSTWLLTRVHELEYRLRSYNERLKEVRNAEGDVCFEEPVASSSSALSTAGSDNASLQSSTKQATLKSLIRPVNGYLDHGPVSEAAQIVQTSANWSYSSQLEQDLQRTASVILETEGSCSRIRPLKLSSFRKRKLIFTTGLHAANTKMSRLSTIRCYCNSQNVMSPCILCTGRYNNVQSVDPDSMPIQDRIALLDPYFHPLLSLEKDVLLDVQLEHVLKKREAQYQNLQPLSPVASHRRVPLGSKPKRFSDIRGHRNRFSRALSAKYHNKHIRSSKHLRKHRLVFGKWRRLHNKNPFIARDHIRRLSVASSASSRDSPVPSPMSIYDEGYDHMKKRRDDNQFDIDDVIIPCSSKSGRLVEIQYKEIVIPSWRCIESSGNDLGPEDIENITDDLYIRRHDKLELEEKKKGRTSASGSASIRRGRRFRSDSRADSSGANTPDPVLLCNQDIMFQVPNSGIVSDTLSPASPPTTPSSATVVSDDSQPFGSGSLARYERRKFISQKRPSEESTCTRVDYDELPPYEQHKFPLSDKEYEEMLAECVNETVDNSPSIPSCPASPESSTSSTSTVEEEEDVTDPEWTVVRRESGSEQQLVLKFAKR